MRRIKSMNNMPNLLSFSRIVATILVFVLAILNQPWSFLIATVVFFLASMTDLLDGYLARRYHLVSPLGVFLDLTADKGFVSAILVAYVQIGLVPASVAHACTVEDAPVVVEVVSSGFTFCPILRSVPASKRPILS